MNLLINFHGPATVDENALDLIQSVSTAVGDPDQDRVTFW